VDLPRLEQTLDCLNSIGSHLQTTIARINFAAERERLVDQLLDLVIALESIFGDESGAIGYKVGLRCSKFVGKDINERERINSLVNKVFNDRHRLVHGRAGGSGSTTAQQTIEFLEIVQRSVSACFDHFNSHARIPNAKDFDRLLLT